MERETESDQREGDSSHERERELDDIGEFLKPNMRKLALWHARNYRPIMTHDELEPIMATLGFVGLEPVLSGGEGAEPVYWKEYMHPSESSLLNKYDPNDITARMVPLTKPRLPYPFIDGLHKKIYLVFFYDIDFYLSSGTFATSHFLIQEMLISWPSDLEWKWQIMESTNENLVCKMLGIEDSILRRSMTHYTEKMEKKRKNEKEETGDDLLLQTFVNLDEIVVLPKYRDDIDRDDG